MAPKRILMASPNYSDSPFRVESHHLARRFVRLGWEVAYISDPISPSHFLQGCQRDLRRRLAIYLAGGRRELDGRLWTYLPACLLPPQRHPILRSELTHRTWQRWTFPNVVSQIRRCGFGTVDLLYIDSISQPFWLNVLDYRKAVYRLTDFSPDHGKFTPAARQMEEEMARRVDLVVYPSHGLRGYVDGLGARRSLYLSNGVEFDHLVRPQPPPPEYAARTGPIAVYVGKIPPWFHF